MAKINHEEYETLKDLCEIWEWMARDENGQLYKYMGKPRKINDFNWNDPAETWLRMNDDNFKFVQFSDSEPYSIDELIKEYEYESEETEVKSKQELIEKWELAIESAEFYGKGKEERLISYMKDFVSDLNQLDEPEVLSEYWIEQKSIDTHVDTLNGEIQLTFRLDDLENLPLPEQELPVIPQFVADYLKGKEEYMLYELLDNDFIYDNHDELARWLYDNDEKTNREREISLVLAQKYGYEVEEEPLYRARLKVITDEFIASYLRTQSSGAEDRLKALEIGSKYIHEDYRHLSEFTEGELKRLDIWGSNQWEIEGL